VLDVPGQPQSETSPQASEALKQFLNDPDDSETALYGFSGGGYNVRYVLLSLAKNNPQTIHRIKLVVVLGSPRQPKSAYDASKFNEIIEANNNKTARANWKPAAWDVVWRDDPDKSILPKDVDQSLDPHMFGPEALLYENHATLSPVRMRRHSNPQGRRR